MSPLIWWQIIWLPPIWIQFISCSLSVVVIQLLSCITLCNHMDCSIPAFPVFHYLPEFAQTQVHSVGDAIQPSHPLLPPFPPIPNLSQHWGLFQWVGFSHLVAKVLKLQLQYQSFQWICRLIFIFMILRFFFKKERMLLYLTWRETCSSLQMWLGNRWGASRTLCHVPRSIPAGVLWMGYPEASSLCLRAALLAWTSPSAVSSLYPVVSNKSDLFVLGWKVLGAPESSSEWWTLGTDHLSLETSSDTIQPWLWGWTWWVGLWGCVMGLTQPCTVAAGGWRDPCVGPWAMTVAVSGSSYFSLGLISVFFWERQWLVALLPVLLWRFSPVSR